MTLNYKHLAFFLFVFTGSIAQVGIGTTTPEGALDVSSNNSGVVVPRVALTSKTDLITVVNPQGGNVVNGTLVWNTTTAGVIPNDVAPGFYYYTHPTWTALGGDTTRQWSLSGNTGTTPGTDFLGTTDAVNLRVKTGGSDRFDFTSNGRLRSYNDGSAAEPTYSWNGAMGTTMGMYRGGQNILSFSTATTERLRIPNAAQIHAGALGTNALPFYSFINDPNTGMYSAGADLLSFSTNGLERLRIPATNQIFAMSLGLVGAPFYSFSADPNTGMYSPSADALAFSTNGTQRLRLLNNGQVVINNTGAIPVNDQFSVYSPGYAINGYSTGVNGIGVYGQTASASGGIGVYGNVSGTASIGTFGSTNNGTGFGVRARNTNISGTAVLGVGNNVTGTYLNTGSGGAFTGIDTGLYAYTTGGGITSGLLTQDPFGNQWEVGAWDGLGYYKIIGTGAVSTIVKDLNNERVVMQSTESPEGLFEDYGIGQLVNGKAHITIDPIFSKNIKVSDEFPMKVFVQLEGECNGVYVTNKSATSFDVIELQSGNSNVKFSYSIVANRADEQYTSDAGDTRNAVYSTRFKKAPKIRENQQAKEIERTKDE